MAHIGDHVMMRQLKTLKNAQHLLLASPETRAQPNRIHGACPVTLYGDRVFTGHNVYPERGFHHSANLGKMPPFTRMTRVSVHSIVIGDKQ